MAFKWEFAIPVIGLAYLAISRILKDSQIEGFKEGLDTLSLAYIDGMKDVLDEKTIIEVLEKIKEKSIIEKEKLENKQ